MRCLSIVFALSTFSQVAFADASTSAPSDQPSTSYGFDDELVTGDTYSPDTERLIVRKRSARASLIEVKSSYIPELLRSVEDM